MSFAAYAARAATRIVVWGANGRALGERPATADGALVALYDVSRRDLPVRLELFYEDGSSHTSAPIFPSPFDTDQPALDAYPLPVAAIDFEYDPAALALRRAAEREHAQSLRAGGEFDHVQRQRGRLASAAALAALITAPLLAADIVLLTLTPSSAAAQVLGAGVLATAIILLLALWRSRRLAHRLDALTGQLAQGLGPDVRRLVELGGRAHLAGHAHVATTAACECSGAKRRP
ncbi:MAG: hypothetical protein KF729_25980 [Sandaracinaceae bacterium]|nr:hypothetical protein [Sandaracinaceae bacterium]